MRGTPVTGSNEPHLSPDRPPWPPPGSPCFRSVSITSTHGDGSEQSQCWASSAVICASWGICSRSAWDVPATAPSRAVRPAEAHTPSTRTAAESDAPAATRRAACCASPRVGICVPRCWRRCATLPQHTLTCQGVFRVSLAQKPVAEREIRPAVNGSRRAVGDYAIGPADRPESGSAFLLVHDVHP